MTGNTAQSADDWKKTAATRSRRTMAAWIGVPVLGTLSASMIGVAVGLNPDAPAWPLVAIGLAGLVVTMLWGTLFYMRTVDEQERDANLWGTYAGMSVYLAAFVLWNLLAMLRIAPAVDHNIIFFVTMAVVLAVFVWRKYR